MKINRIGLIAFILIILFSLNAYALDTTLLDMRNKIFKESKEIKALLTRSKDVFLINSMWDSCVLTMAQLDAYFSMLGIFNTIRNDCLSPTAVDYLSDWLKEIKQSNDLNVKSLNSFMMTIEPETKGYVDALKDYYNDLNARIDKELNKLTLYKKTFRR